MLQGKGMYIWKLKDCEGGDPAVMAQEAKNAGLSHVLIKILDGPWFYNLRPYYDKNGNLKWADDILPPAVAAFKAAGLEVWGWQYVYLSHPELEGQRAVLRVNDLGLDGFAIDAEKECKNQPAKTKTYVANLKGINAPVALSTYRRPDLHPEIDYKTFLSVCDYNMPQVYWEGAHNAGQQLTRSMAEYAKITKLPMIPTGSAYKRGNWSATPADLVDFMNTAKSAGLSGVNFWVWNHLHAKGIPGLWDTIAGFPWGGPTPPPPPPPATVPLSVWARDYANPFLAGLGYNGPAPE